MSSLPQAHCRKTARLALALRPKDVFDWLMTVGYYPEPYVLPPCFRVTKYKGFGASIFSGKRFKPQPVEPLPIQFPKSDFTDRAFGVIDPELHRELALVIARNWRTIVRHMFRPSNCVWCYSFPVPLDARHVGTVGTLRAGRMIYEFLEMAEADLAAEAFKYKCLITTDIKNCYSSIYTHSIAWALHGKGRIRKGRNRWDPRFVGNRLDQLFTAANDGCTNGLPIGPAVSDVASEIVLAAVDAQLSARLRKANLLDDVLTVRFKDDYRILAQDEQTGRTVTKELQSAAREFHLELHEDKTEFHALPDGLFRRWFSQYYLANPHPKRQYDFRRFKEVCLAVVEIDKANPSVGVVDRFLNDIADAKKGLRLRVRGREVPRVISMLLMLARLRVKAFPKALAVIEAILRTPDGLPKRRMIGEHFAVLFEELNRRPSENAFLQCWICYFMRSNRLMDHFKRRYRLSDPIVRASYTSRFGAFASRSQFTLFEPVQRASNRATLLQHLSVFERQNASLAPVSTPARRRQ